MSSNQATETTAWLVYLGKEEIRIAKELGWDHPAVLQAQHRFRDAYQAVKAIRNAYEAQSSQKEDN
jgi:hypothetical protein